MKKTHDLMARKYYWPIFQDNIEAYVKGYDVYPILKIVKHKSYSDLQSLPVPTYHLKELLMDFVTDLLISTHWKWKLYDSILVIIERLTKIVYYELVKIIIGTLALAEAIIEVIVK